MLFLILAACSGAPVSLTLADAPTSDASRVNIEDGVFDSAAATHDFKCGAGAMSKGQTPCVEHSFRVVPIRSSTAPTGPVMAWANCPTGTDAVTCTAFLQGKQARGRVLWRYREDHKTGWLTAIQASGLSSAEGAPVLSIE